MGGRLDHGQPRPKAATDEPAPRATVAVSSAQPPSVHPGHPSPQPNNPTHPTQVPASKCRSSGGASPAWQRSRPSSAPPAGCSLWRSRCGQPPSPGSRAGLSPPAPLCWWRRPGGRRWTRSQATSLASPPRRRRARRCGFTVGTSVRARGNGGVERGVEAPRGGKAGRGERGKGEGGKEGGREGTGKRLGGRVGGFGRQQGTSDPPRTPPPFQG